MTKVAIVARVWRDGKPDGFRIPRDAGYLEKLVRQIRPALIVIGGSLMAHLESARTDSRSNVAMAISESAAIIQSARSAVWLDYERRAAGASGSVAPPAGPRRVILVDQSADAGLVCKPVDQGSSGYRRRMNGAKWGTVKSTRPWSGLYTRPFLISESRCTDAPLLLL